MLINKHNLATPQTQIESRFFLFYFYGYWESNPIKGLSYARQVLYHQAISHALNLKFSQSTCGMQEGTGLGLPTLPSYPSTD